MIIMKKIKIIGVFIMMCLSFLSHFMYEWCNNFLFSIFFPVNESIWEHMKLLITPVLIYALIEYFIYKNKSIKFNNFSLSYGISIIIGIILYLIIYLPFYHFFGNNIILSILLLFFDYIFISFISYLIINMRKIKYSKTIGTLLIIFIYFMFYYLTYYPIHYYIFYDTENNVYGIIKED
ncbi:MAG: DUF6512 family protein [Bacilli bacterium]